MPRDSKYHQGFFHPQNPEKYIGNPQNIVYRSSWELKFMRWCDRTPSVLKYGSEEFFVPYFNPVKNKVCRYFPDFIVTKINKEGKKETALIEVKPFKQTLPPARQANMTRKYLTEVKNWGINEAKWNAAKSYCEDRGWSFHIFTEKELGIK